MPRSEEYLDSEKYQIRRWDWSGAAHIKDLIAAVNRIRREHAAFRFFAGLRFHETDNPQIVAYTKESPDASSRVLVVVNLDPHNMQHGWITAAPGRLGAGPEAAYLVRDWLTNETFTWAGERHYVRLEPARPGHILTVEP